MNTSANNRNLLDKCRSSLYTQRAQDRNSSLTFDKNQLTYLTCKITCRKLTEHTHKYGMKITWIPWRRLVLLFQESLVNTSQQCTAQYLQWRHKDFRFAGGGQIKSKINCWGTKFQEWSAISANVFYEIVLGPMMGSRGKRPSALRYQHICG